MKVVIVGAGTVGSYLAERLALEGQDIVVVESDEEHATVLQANVDCLVVGGNGASGAVLEEAGIADADLMIAVTNSDAANVLACHAAARLGVPRTVARIEDPALRAETRVLGVDIVIDPGEALARELLALVRQGGVAELIEFGDGRLVLLGGFVPANSPVAGGTLEDLREAVVGWNWIVTALIRHGETIVARGDTEILAGDHVFLMAKAERRDEAIRHLGLELHPARKVMVIGATRLAQLTATLFAEEGLQTVLIDEEEDKCRAIAAKDAPVVVVCGDPTDPKVLRSEGIENVDAVLALTGWDEKNLLACLVAKAMGAEMVVARFRRSDLIGMLPGLGIDAAVSSKIAAANAILRFVRRGTIHSVAAFQDSDAEAIEFQVGDDSVVVGQSLAEIGLPHSVMVGGVLRDREAIIPRGSTVIEPGDRLIVFALPDAIARVEKLLE